MALLETASGVMSVLGGLKGLFGKKAKNPTPRDNLLSQLQGIEEGAEKYGYNRLTLLQHGQTGGTGLGASGPPLASFDMLSDGFREIGDVVSGDADRRRQAENLKLDLAKLEIERLQAGHAADAVGGVSPLGNRAKTVAQTNVNVPGFGLSPKAPAPRAHWRALHKIGHFPLCDRPPGSSNNLAAALLNENGGVARSFLDPSALGHGIDQP